MELGESPKQEAFITIKFNIASCHNLHVKLIIILSLEESQSQLTNTGTVDDDYGIQTVGSVLLKKHSMCSLRLDESSF